jgi:nucleotide-binding universal stress UspA family protein
MIFGSTAERVVRKARCPVLTVPPANVAQMPDE